VHSQVSIIADSFSLLVIFLENEWLANDPSLGYRVNLPNRRIILWNMSLPRVGSSASCKLLNSMSSCMSHKLLCLKSHICTSNFSSVTDYSLFAFIMLVLLRVSIVTEKLLTYSWSLQCFTRFVPVRTLNGRWEVT
jgi:hypothetical protein